MITLVLEFGTHIFELLQKKNHWSPLILILSLRAPLAFAKSQLYIPVLLRTLSRDIRIENCESWFASPTPSPSCSFHGLIALKPTESSQSYAPTGVVVQVASDFREIRWHSVPTNLRCSWTRQRDRFNTISILLCYSVNSLHKALYILGKSGWRYTTISIRWCIMCDTCCDILSKFICFVYERKFEWKIFGTLTWLFEK